MSKGMNRNRVRGNVGIKNRRNNWQDHEQGQGHE
jgi:hypothetical protein